MKPTDKNDTLDIKDLLNDYLRHWWWFAISVFVCALLAVVWVKTHKPEYMVRANVIVSQDESSALSALSGLGDIMSSGANAEDEQFVISSHSVLRDVTRDLGINKLHYTSTGMLGKALRYPDFPVDVQALPSVIDTLSTTLKFKVKIHKDGTADIRVKEGRHTIGKADDVKLPATVNTSWGSYVVTATSSFPRKIKKSFTAYIDLSGYDVAAEDLAMIAYAQRATKKSNMIEMYCRTTNVRYGEAILNEMIANYNRRAIAFKNLQGEKTQAFLNERLALISGDLADAEQDIESYKTRKGITDVGAEAEYNMRLRGTASQELVRAQTESELIRMTRDFLTQPGNSYELIPVTAQLPGTVSSSISQYNNLIIWRMQLMANAKGNNRQLKQLEEQLDIIRSTINASLAKAYETSLVSIREARQQLGIAESKLGNVPSQEREFLDLKRQQAVKQEIYVFLLQRREETAMMIANAIPKGRIVDEAYTLSEPVSRSKWVILAIALFLGLLIPPVILYMRGLLRNKFSTPEELKKLTTIPLLGQICSDDSGDRLVVRPQSDTSVSELFRLLRTNLEFMTRAAGDKVILVTSTRPGEGKSFVSVNLAATLALGNKRVVLVGMDIRKPQLGNYLNLTHGLGVTNFLSDPSIPVADLIIHRTGIPGCDVILSGPVPPNPAELISSENLQTLVDTLRREYDYIIIDSAPVGMVSDTLILSRVADMTVYVTRANYTVRRDIAYINEINEANRLPRLSMVLNGVQDHHFHGYGYGYGYGHNKG